MAKTELYFDQGHILVQYLVRAQNGAPLLRHLFASIYWHMSWTFQSVVPIPTLYLSAHQSNQFLNRRLSVLSIDIRLHASPGLSLNFYDFISIVLYLRRSAPCKKTSASADYIHLEFRYLPNRLAPVQVTKNPHHLQQPS